MAKSTCVVLSYKSCTGVCCVPVPLATKTRGRKEFAWRAKNAATTPAAKATQMGIPVASITASYDHHVHVFALRRAVRAAP
jgi:hypothetical protein